MHLTKKGERKLGDCVFYHVKSSGISNANHGENCSVQKVDVLGGSFDFILKPLPNEISARKIVMPFRPDLVEKWKIRKGDIILGRPMSAGCPVQHVLQVITANYVTGILDTWCVGPRYSRNRKVHDFQAYVMLGFEGIAQTVTREPEFGRRQRFLPGFCMMNVTHTGVVNMTLSKSSGLHVRIEDIRIL
jgi:uncharacterized Fe-S cluster-containing protein